MDKDKALNLLIANVYCVDTRLDCRDCPLHIEGHEDEGCKELDDDKLLEAVRTLE